MLIGDGGGGTDWSSMSMDMMRLMIKTPDTAAYYEMLDGWKHSYELLDVHRSQVESYRDALAAAWPPDKSEAARTYVGRLNEMLANLNQTYEAALQNHRAFADAALSIGLAQSDFDRIDQEYANNQAALNAFESKMAQDTTATEKSTPPVAEGRQEQLRLQAAARLSSVSTDLAQAQAQIRQPQRYALLPLRGVTGSSDIAEYVPPMIPPIAASYVDTNAFTAERSTRPPVALPTGHGKTGISPITTHPVTTQPAVKHKPGLVLGNTGEPVVASPTDGVPSTVPIGGATGQLVDALPPAGTSPLMPTGETSTAAPKPGARRVQGILGEPQLGSSGAPEGMRALPSGGMITGPVGRSTGQSSSTRSGMRRINPVGGMIGEGEGGTRSNTSRPLSSGDNPVVGSPSAGGRPAPSLGLGMPGARNIPESGRPGNSARGAIGEHSYGQIGKRNSFRRNLNDFRSWDPDNPWETDEGVEPVLMPSREQRVDPGPAIGLP